MPAVCMSERITETTREKNQPGAIAERGRSSKTSAILQSMRVKPSALHAGTTNVCSTGSLTSAPGASDWWSSTPDERREASSARQLGLRDNAGEALVEEDACEGLAERAVRGAQLADIEMSDAVLGQQPRIRALEKAAPLGRPWELSAYVSPG